MQVSDATRTKRAVREFADQPLTDTLDSEISFDTVLKHIVPKPTHTHAPSC
jgi:hypothetical protein